jgi:aminoglycoside phosphotransferase (APT) family kinase protein
VDAVVTDVADAVLGLVDDPAPLVAELEACGSTLIHADIRDEQIGLEGDRLVLLDWGRATRGHPVVDFFWSMCHNAWRIDAGHDELVQDYRRVRGERDDPRAVELGVIAGLVMYGWVFGHSAARHPDPAERRWARDELAWWVPRARRALDTWSPA